jgi:RimJ/RimL family protein N-acetyltransferase
VKPVLLRTARLVLSTPVASDAAAIFAHCQDADLQRWTTVPVPYTADDARTFVDEHVPQGWRDGTEAVLAIRPAGASTLMGLVAWQRRRGFVGYWMGAGHRGQGYMAEALRAVVEWVLGPSHDVASLRWEAVAGNVGSAHVARAAGFRWVGFGPCDVVDRSGSRPPGWHAVITRDDLGSVEPLERWPVLA